MDYNININSLPKVRNGRLWYVIILPALGLFLENFATNMWLGIFLWLSVILLSIVVCVNDEKELRSFGVSHLKLYKSRFFPPIYVYRRLQSAHQSKVPFGVYIFIVFIALINNGFTSALNFNDENYIKLIQLNYVSSISQFEDYESTDIIEERLEEFAIEDTLKWSYAEDNKYKYITVSGLSNYNNKSSQRFEIIFRLDFDGFAITEIEIINVKFSGAEMNDIDSDALLYNIFIEKSNQYENNNFYFENDNNYI